MQLGSSGTGVGLIIAQSHCSLLAGPVRLPLASLERIFSPDAEWPEPPMTRSAEVRPVGGWAGGLEGLCVLSWLFSTPPPRPSTRYFLDFVPAPGLLTGSWVSGFDDHQVGTDLYSSRSTLAGH